MSEVFSGKLRAIGSSVGLLVPKKQMDSLNLKEGEEVDVATPIVRYKCKVLEIK